jgi:phosphoserine phosphatase RsbX
MTAASLQREQGIEWSVASRALPGERMSGDLHVVAGWADGVLAGVVDGLGHGDEAMAAARTAVAVLEEHAGQSVIALVRRCHEALRGTRGAVMTLVSVDHREQTATTVGVGNVETVLFRANPLARPRRESVLLRGGVVGYNLPQLQASVFPLAAGDVVVFATDGLREDFAELVTETETVSKLAGRVMARKFRGTDDALVLAFRYLGRNGGGA